MADDTRTIEQQLTDAIVSAINAAADLPDVEVDRYWDIDDDEVGALGVVILSGQGSTPVERQTMDDPADDRNAVVSLAIYAQTRARVDAIRARIQQLVCFTAPAESSSPFFRLAKRIRPGAWSLETGKGGKALGKLMLNPDSKQLVTDPTRWK